MADNKYVNANVHVLPNGRVSAVGHVFNTHLFSKMEVYAANPIQRSFSYSGSGLPFPNADIAFDNTPNIKEIPATGDFKVDFSYPNSFQSTDGFQKIPPSVFVRLVPHKEGQEPIQIRYGLPDPLPLKTVAYRPNFALGPIFYSAKSDVVPFGTAEQTMRNLSEAKVKYDIA